MNAPASNHVSSPPRYPGIHAIVDGSEAIAYVEQRIAEGACAYPITPSTNMGTYFQIAVAEGRANLWGTTLRFLEPESEHSSASAAEGFALAGGRVVNFTSGQGLILMKEVLYVIAGKRLPAVFHVGARALTSHALNIHAGHDDVYGVADCGWGALFARNAQEAADLTAICRRVAEDTETPFLCVQDGFLTTHANQNVLLPEDELLKEYVGDPRETLRNLFDPAEALMSGVVQNQDAYMKGRIAQRTFYERIPESVHEAMREWGELTGRWYDLITAHQCDDAETIVVSMGTIADTAQTVVEHLREQGRKVGCVTVTSYRPFPAKQLVDVLGKARAVCVIERTDEPAAADNPLTREIKAALATAHMETGSRIPQVLSASAGLGSRDVAAGDLIAVFDLLDTPGHYTVRRHFALNIKHPLAIESVGLDIRPKGAYSLRGHSIGGFGSVTTNKLVATLVGELFDKQVQAYPRYGSEKKGLPTTYFLTIADETIRQHAELSTVDLVPLHDVTAFALGNPLAGLVDGGVVFLQSPFKDPKEIWESLPAGPRAEMVKRHVKLVALDTLGLAREYAPRPELEIRMQGVAQVGVFLRVSPFAGRAALGRDELFDAVQRQLTRFFGKRGTSVVDANLSVIKRAYDELIDVTGSLGLLEPIASSRPLVEASR